MCGIAGFWSRSTPQPEEEMHAIARRMGKQLLHRGPDQEGSWVDVNAGIGLANRRLSIIDPSPSGNQPMLSVDGRYVLVHNGEIYNFPELRKELEKLGCALRGHSDTEVLLAAITRWGVEASLVFLNGMFAFAVWDRHTRQLHLVRDRVGEKPLYYGWQGGSFLFASEIKALRVHPAFQPRIDQDALALYLRYNFIPSPYSIYTGVFKLRPGHRLKITDPHADSKPDSVAFWSVHEVAKTGLSEPFSGDDGEAVSAVEEGLIEAVRSRMVSDVPLGAFLSGGVDSSTIVALMQSHSSSPVKTFSIGFAEASYDEADQARAVAKHLGTDHTEYFPTSEEVRSVIPRLPELYDEPFGDSSQIPTFLLSRLARRSVKVSLSGDGGDELFGGYNRYLWAGGPQRRLGRLPCTLRAVAAAFVRSLSTARSERAHDRFGFLLPEGFQLARFKEKMNKLADILVIPEAQHQYQYLLSQWKSPEELLAQGREASSEVNESSNWEGFPDMTHAMMHMDLLFYLPEDVLVKLDRASMGVGLEARVPYLDHRLIELAWRLPLSMKIRRRQTKWVLRQVLYKYVPKQLIKRPKRGFEVPLDSWLRGPLRDWAGSLLDETRLKREGYLNPVPIRRTWEEHLRGREHGQHRLWGVLMFQQWLDQTRSLTPG